jgi:hypothetical protein
MNRFSSTDSFIKSFGHAIGGKNAETIEVQFVLRLLTFFSPATNWKLLAQGCAIGGIFLARLAQQKAPDEIVRGLEIF